MKTKKYDRIIAAIKTEVQALSRAAWDAVTAHRLAYTALALSMIVGGLVAHRFDASVDHFIKEFRVQMPDLLWVAKQFRVWGAAWTLHFLRWAC